MRTIDRIRLWLLGALVARELGVPRGDVEAVVWDPSNNDWKFPVSVFYRDEFGVCDLSVLGVRKQAKFVASQISLYLA